MIQFLRQPFSVRVVNGYDLNSIAHSPPLTRIRCYCSSAQASASISTLIFGLARAATYNNVIAGSCPLSESFHIERWG